MLQSFLNKAAHQTLTNTSFLMSTLKINLTSEIFLVSNFFDEKKTVKEEFCHLISHSRKWVNLLCHFNTTIGFFALLITPGNKNKLSQTKVTVLV